MITFLRSLVIAIILLFLGYSLLQNIFNYRQKLTFYENFKKEHAQKAEENRRLQSEIIKSKDIYQIEKSVRNKLNLTKPGEVALILPPTAPLITPTLEVVKSVPVQWLELFVK